MFMWSVGLPDSRGLDAWWMAFGEETHHGSGRLSWSPRRASAVLAKLSAAESPKALYSGISVP